MQANVRSGQSSRSASPRGSQRSSNAASIVNDTPIMSTMASATSTCTAMYTMSSVTNTVTLAVAGTMSRAGQTMADTRTVTSVTSAIQQLQSVADHTVGPAAEGMALRTGKQLPPVVVPGAVSTPSGYARRPNPTVPIPTPYGRMPSPYGRGTRTTVPGPVSIRTPQPYIDTIRVQGIMPMPPVPVLQPVRVLTPTTSGAGLRKADDRTVRPVSPRPTPRQANIADLPRRVRSPITVRKRNFVSHDNTQNQENQENPDPHDFVQQLGYKPVVNVDNIEPHDSASNVTPNRSQPEQSDLGRDPVVDVASEPQADIVDRWLDGQPQQDPNDNPGDHGKGPRRPAPDLGPPLPTQGELITQLVKEKQQLIAENRRLADLNRQQEIEGQYYAAELVKAVKQNDQIVQENELLQAPPHSLRVNGLAPDARQARQAPVAPEVAMPPPPPPPAPSRIASVRSVGTVRSRAFSVVNSTRLNNMIRDGLKDALAASAEKGKHARERSPPASQPPGKRQNCQNFVPETPEHATGEQPTRPASRGSSVLSRREKQSDIRSDAQASHCTDSPGQTGGKVQPNGSGECPTLPSVYPNNGYYSAPYMTNFHVPPPPPMAQAMAQYPSPLVNTTGTSTASATQPPQAAKATQDKTPDPAPAETTKTKSSGPKLREYGGGKESWDVYNIHLRTVKRLNGWSQMEALDNLVAKLKGDASKFYATLPMDRQDDYEYVCKNMARRFPEVQSASAARLRLERLQQKADQTLEHLAQEVNTLGYAAFPGSVPEWVETECVRAFLRAVADKQMAVTVAAGEHKRMTDVLQAAIKYHDASQDFGPTKSKSVRQALVEMADIEPSSKEDEVWVEKVRQMTSVDQTTKSNAQKTQQTKPTGNGGGARAQPNQNAQNQSRSSGQSGQSAQPGKPRPAPSGRPNRPCLLCGQNGHWAQGCELHPNNWSSELKAAYSSLGKKAVQPVQTVQPAAPQAQQKPAWKDGPVQVYINTSDIDKMSRQANNGNNGKRPNNNNKKKGNAGTANKPANQNGSESQNRGGNNNKSTKASGSQPASSGNDQGNEQ